METPVQDVAMDEPIDLRDPYPMFARSRPRAACSAASVMDWSKTPDSLKPENIYAAVSFDAVNRVFRDGKLFNSTIYDATIGLFIGPTILAMEGKPHWEHRNLVSAAFKSRSLARWEPEIVRPVVNELIDEFIETGEADLVRDFTFEFPTRVISKLLGLPEEDLPWFRKRAVELISYTVKYKRAFEASAALKDYFLEQIEKRRSAPDRGHHRRSGVGRDRRREAQRRSDLLVPAAAAARRPGDHLPIVGQPALPAAHPPRPVRRGAGRPRTDRPGDRGGPALRDTADHRAALRDRGHRTRRASRSPRAR